MVVSSLHTFKKKNKKKFLLLSYLICLFSLTIGFAYLSSDLNIDGQVEVTSLKDIKIIGVEVISNTNEGSSNNEINTARSVTSSVTLPYANSTITYHITVKNDSDIEQGIFKIDEIYKNINTNEDSDLEIKSKSVNLKETLCDDSTSSQCKLGSVTTFDIVVGYKDNGYNETDFSYLVELDFDFRRIFNITYVGFSGNISGLPNKVIDGDDINVTFDNVSGIPSSTTVTGATGTYTSPSLLLTNIEDDITITGIFQGELNEGYIYSLNFQNDYIYMHEPISSSITTYNTPAEAMASFHNSPFYFRHHLNNDSVDESYLAFVITPEMALDDSDLTAGTYYLRGGIDESESVSKPLFDANVNVLKQAFGENNDNCTDFTDTSSITCNRFFGISLSSYGIVSLYINVDAINDYVYCAVSEDGDSRCVI